jgi:hypothetical protein
MAMLSTESLPCPALPENKRYLLFEGEDSFMEGTPKGFLLDAPRILSEYI